MGITLLRKELFALFVFSSSVELFSYVFTLIKFRGL